ncbi:hypothetical protein V1478_015887 [Vespula squamosa]|uniref:C2H2-type domain-containing protein n=1 Tax=Vespula squamosa TaxID=30214 RepID=A0ABD2A2J5_VESSQ
MEDTKEYDALWMLERKARSIGEDQESFLGPMKSISSKMPEQAGPSYPIAQLYGGDSYIAVLQAQYVCTDCGKKYKWQDSLKRHQRVDCGNKEKKFSCNVCDRKFKYQTFSSNKLSLVSSSNDQKDSSETPRIGLLPIHRYNVCTKCGKDYKWRCSLLRHQMTDCGKKEKRFSCSICPKKYYHRFELEKHYQTSHKILKNKSLRERYDNVCNRCGKDYKWRCSLSRHQKEECGNKLKKFSCRLCLKKFFRRYKLYHHYQECRVLLSKDKI